MYKLGRSPHFKDSAIIIYSLFDAPSGVDVEFLEWWGYNTTHAKNFRSHPHCGELHSQSACGQCIAYGGQCIIYGGLHTPNVGVSRQFMEGYV